MRDTLITNTGRLVPDLLFQSMPTHSHRHIPITAMTTGTTAFVVQMFLIRRYHHFARIPAVTWSLVLTAFLSLSSCYILAVTEIVHNSYFARNRKLIRISGTIWIVLTVVTDCFIAAALVVQLHRMKSGFKSSESLIRRITVITIQTGTVTSILQLIGLGTFLGSIQGNLSIAVGFCIGCVYTLTMLHNLNERNTLAGISQSRNAGGQDGATSPDLPEGEPGSLGFNLTRILSNCQKSVEQSSSDQQPESRTRIEESHASEPTHRNIDEREGRVVITHQDDSSTLKD
jgi:hypothetical protein